MGILSGFTSRVKSTLSGIGGAISRALGGSSNQGASAIMSTPSTPSTSGRTSSGASGSWAAPSTTASSSILNAGSVYVPQVYTGGGVIGTYSPTTPGDYNQLTGSYNPPVPTTVSAGGKPSAQTQFAGTSVTAPTYSPESLSMGASTLSAGGGTVSAPSAPSYTDTGLVNNAGLVSVLQEQFDYDPATNTFQALPTEQTPAEAAAQERKKWYEDIIGMAPEKESVLGSPEVMAAQEEVQRRRQEVANYTSQLNAIVAQQNADLLRLREVGSREGVTEAVYGGQQLTINREAAIRALPVQAQIAAAQGNLELAQDYLGQITALKQEQVDNYYDYRKTVYDTFKEYATNEQKIKLDAINKADERAYTERTNNIQRQDAWAKEALATGQRVLMGKISSLNASSPTFNNDLARLTSQISAPVSAKAPEVKSINGVDMQWNSSTGQWEVIPGAGGDQSAYQVERAARTIESVDSLAALAKQNPEIFGRSAALPLPDYLRSDAYRNFRAQLDTLKSNIAFGELTAMREASKTGGALGQVSDREGKLLESALGALDMSQSPEAFQAQLTKIKESIQRWQAAGGQTTGATGTETMTDTYKSINLNSDPLGIFQ